MNALSRLLVSVPGFLLMLATSGQMLAVDAAAVAVAVGETGPQVCKNPPPPIHKCLCPPNYNCPRVLTKGKSTIDNLNFSFDHDAYDYVIGKSTSDCSTCGSGTVLPTDGNVPTLQIRRHHRFRDLAYQSSFGPGIFHSYDMSLQLFTTANGDRYVDFYTTESNVATRFFDGPWTNNSFGYADPADGIYKDLINNSYKQLQLFDASGQVTQVHVNAVTARIEGNDGRSWSFQIIDLGGGLRGGRVTSIADARGYAISIAYAYQPSDDLQGSQARLWQIATITDALANVATFQYATTQVAGRWVVDQIVLPTGATVSYQYAGGYLSGVNHPDGTSSSFTYGYDTISKCTVLGIDDAAADTTHRRKTVHVSTNYTLLSSQDGVFFPQSAQLIRMMYDGTGALTYFNIPHPWGTAAYVYEGGNMMKYVAYDMWGNEIALYGRYAKSWSMTKTDPAAPWTWGNFALALESGFKAVVFSNGDNQKGLYRNEYLWGRDAANLKSVYTGYAGSGLFLKNTFPDTTTELTEYGALNRVTRSVDRLGRVTEQTFDGVGNRLSRTTGSTWDAANSLVVTTPDTTTETWEYIAAGQPNQYRMAAHIDARGNRTDYAYDSRGRLILVTESADIAGGTRPVTTYQYDSASRLIKTIEPTITKWVSLGYDARSRVVTVTYADGSTETTSYGTGQDANLVVHKIDRNGNVTSLSYDAHGRKILETTSGPTGPALRTQSWTYLTGSNEIQSTTVNGEVTEYTLDYLHRVVATTQKPKAGVLLTNSAPRDGMNRSLGHIDAWGRKTWTAYNANNYPVRTVRELVIGGLSGVPSDDAARNTFLLALTRPSSANPSYIIEDTAFDVEGQVLSRTDASGTVTTFSYTHRGQLASQTEAVGTPDAATSTFTYDAAGNRLTVTDPRATTAMAYTGRNLLATVTEAVGTGEATLVRSLTYTPTKKVASEADALGRTTTFDYGLCCDRLKKITDPAGFQTQFLYDFNGNRTSVTDANGLTSTMAFDALNRPVTSSNAAAEATVMVYDENLTDGAGIDAVPAVSVVLPGLGLGAGADGSAVKVTNPKGESAYELRDGLGRPVARIDPLGNVTKVAYDSVVSGLVETTQTDALNHTTKVRTDAAGRARIQIDALGNQSQAGFSADGDQVSQVDALGLGWTAVYDARHRLLSRTTTRADAVETTSWTYDLVGNRLTETDALGKTETSQYDLRNRRITLTDRLGGLTRFAYDAVGNLTAISDAENEARGGLGHLAGATQYAYDSRNLLVAEAFPTGQAGRTLRVYAYDGGRRLTARQVGVLSGAVSAAPAFTGSPEATSYAYDSANRLLSRGYADTANDTFAYDLASRLTSAVSARYATTVGRAYDAAGRLTSESLTLPDGSITGTVVAPATYTVAYQYDAANRTTGLTYPTGTQVARTYTARHELATVSMGGSPAATRSYDAAGRLVSTAFGNGVTESRTYVAGSPLVAAIAAAPAVGPAVTAFSYTYDAAGRKLAEQNSIASDQAFGYDVAGRLIDWKQGPTAAPTATQTWNLSLVGDWNATSRDGVSETRQNTWVHEAVQVGTNLLTYDAKGNLTKDEKQTLLAWDPENRLTSALVTPDASETGFGAYAVYRYDALGRRVAKTVNGATTLYLNAGAQTVVELERTAIPTQAQVNGTESDGTAANAARTPTSGGILTGVGAVTRINFQPATTVVPAGFYADTGKTYPVTGQSRTNGLVYGWTTDATADAIARHGSVPLVEFDTCIQAQTTASNTWSIALPNGSYPVVVVAGDALSTDQTNNLVIAGQAVTDATPATTTPGYDQGNFDGFAVQATVSNGMLTIAPGAGALRAKLCFIEIGAQGTLLTQAHRDRLSTLVARANSWTGASVPPQTAVREYAYQSYVDDVAAFTSAVNGGAANRYYVASSHLFSPAVLTNAAGQIVERMEYTAYGKASIKNATGTPLAKSAVGFDRGYTGYVADNETGLMYARTRQYSPSLGRFAGRDLAGYVDGGSTYSAYFAINGIDPSGMVASSALIWLDSPPNYFGADDNNDYVLSLLRDPCGPDPQGPRGGPQGPRGGPQGPRGGPQGPRGGPQGPRGGPQGPPAPKPKPKAKPSEPHIWLGRSVVVYQNGKFVNPGPSSPWGWDFTGGGTGFNLGGATVVYQNGQFVNPGPSSPWGWDFTGGGSGFNLGGATVVYQNGQFVNPGPSSPWGWDFTGGGSGFNLGGATVVYQNGQFVNPGPSSPWGWDFTGGGSGFNLGGATVVYQNGQFVNPGPSSPWGWDFTGPPDQWHSGQWGFNLGGASVWSPIPGTPEGWMFQGQPDQWHSGLWTFNLGGVR